MSYDDYRREEEVADRERDTHAGLIANERRLLGRLMLCPQVVAESLSELGDYECVEPLHRRILQAIREAHAAGELDDHGRPLEEVAWLPALYRRVMSVSEATGVQPPDKARDLALELMQERSIDERQDGAECPWIALGLRKRMGRKRFEDAVGVLTIDPTREESWERVLAARRSWLGDEAVEHMPGMKTGEDLRVLALEEAPKPLVPGLLYPSCLSVLTGGPKTGKSTLAMHAATSIAARLAPWSGAPAPDRSMRVVYVTLDESGGALIRRQRRLDVFHSRSMDRWEHGLSLVCVDRKTSLTDLAPWRLSPDMSKLQSWLVTEEREGRRVDALIFDTLRACLLPGFDENDNNAMQEVAGALAGLAIHTGVAILVLAHPRKMSAQGDVASDDPIAMIRGASAVAGVARCVALLKKPEEGMRELIAALNDGSPISLRFRVADREGEGLDRWVLDQGVAAGRTPIDLGLQPGQEIAIPELALLLDPSCKVDANGRPYQSARTKAANVAAGWARTGWGVFEPGVPAPGKGKTPARFTVGEAGTLPVSPGIRTRLEDAAAAAAGVAELADAPESLF